MIWENGTLKKEHWNDGTWKDGINEIPMFQCSVVLSLASRLAGSF
jgi:hypothetical protein